MNKWIVAKKLTKPQMKHYKDFHPVLAQLLHNRDLKDSNEIDLFLNSGMDKVHSHKALYDIDKAVDHILKAVADKKKIFIHGDYDVDGVCATAVLWDYLYNVLGADVLPYIPNRFDEGYGMSDDSLTAITAQSGQMIITVDCGIRDVELVDKWKKKGLEFIITDHHEFAHDEKGNAQIPAALAVVHPRHPKGKYPYGEICGTTVVWKLISALYEKTGNGNPDSYLDLVALATNCDIMPLVNENRILLKEGLSVFNHGGHRIGLKQLMAISGANISKIDPYHLGFVLGPRINAAGRLETALDALRLVTTQKQSYAREIAGKLNDLNLQRQKLTEELVQEAQKQVGEASDDKLIFAWGEEWPEGVVGLIAGKLCEIYHRPVIVASKNGDIVKGSARSISAFHITESISKFKHLLDKYGGHAQAAGFTLHFDNLKEFQSNLIADANENLKEEDMVNELKVDMELTPSDINEDLMDIIEMFEPFGFRNVTPTFVVRNAKVANLSKVGSQSQHLRFAFYNEDKGGYIEAIGFHMSDKFPNIAEGDTIDLLFSLDWNEWNGYRKIQMKVKDMKVI